MDVKGAKALRERLAHAAHDIDPPPRRPCVRGAPSESQVVRRLRAHFLEEGVGESLGHVAAGAGMNGSGAAA